MSDTLKATAEQYDSQIAQLNQQLKNLTTRRDDIAAARKAIDPALQTLLASEDGGDNSANKAPAPAKPAAAKPGPQSS